MRGQKYLGEKIIPPRWYLLLLYFGSRLGARRLDFLFGDFRILHFQLTNEVGLLLARLAQRLISKESNRYLIESNTKTRFDISFV
jgi:hypothetical protein